LARPKPPGRDDWQRTIGMFTGDSVMREIDDASLKIREEDRRGAQSVSPIQQPRSGKM